MLLNSDLFMISDGNNVYYDSSLFETIVSTTNNLQKFVGKASCKTISKNSFQYCKNTLQTIDFEEDSKLNSIASSVFSNQQCLISANFTNCKDLTIIPESLFQDSTTLQTIILPPTLRTLSTRCFYGCSSLQNFQLPDSTTKLCYWFIRDTPNLQKILFHQIHSSILLSMKVFIDLM